MVTLLSKEERGPQQEKVEENGRKKEEKRTKKKEGDTRSRRTQWAIRRLHSKRRKNILHSKRSFTSLSILSASQPISDGGTALVYKTMTSNAPRHVIRDLNQDNLMWLILKTIGLDWECLLQIRRTSHLELWRFTLQLTESKTRDRERVKGWGPKLRREDMTS